MPDWWLVMGWAIFPGIVEEKASASYNNLPYNSCSLSLLPAPHPRKSGCCPSPSPPPPDPTWWAPGKSPSRMEPGDRAALAMLSPSSLCWAHPGGSSVGGGSPPTLTGRGAYRSHPRFCPFSPPSTSTPRLRVAGGHMEGSLSLSVSPEQCCTFITGRRGMGSWGACGEQGRPLSHLPVASQGLVSSRHRLIMCQLAVQNSDWIR